MKKILILGAYGSGKTILGKALSVKREIPFIDLDDLVWPPK